MCFYEAGFLFQLSLNTAHSLYQGKENFSFNKKNSAGPFKLLVCKSFHPFTQIHIIPSWYYQPYSLGGPRVNLPLSSANIYWLSPISIHMFPVIWLNLETVHQPPAITKSYIHDNTTILLTTVLHQNQVQ